MSLFDVNPDPEEAFLYNTIASICSDYLYVWDLEGDVLLASPNMVSDLGLAGNRLANCSQMDIKWVHPHDRERVQKQYRAFIHSKEESLSLEYQALTANGSYIWLSDRAKMKRDTAGKPLLIVGTLRNMEQYEGVD
ncbi:MAG: PAS domain-containing protein, partial [Hungatella hathewayi]|nr:PAS domain-containing protein [Hungatella hathewayi]